MTLGRYPCQFKWLEAVTATADLSIYATRPTRQRQSFTAIMRPQLGLDRCLMQSHPDTKSPFQVDWHTSASSLGTYPDPLGPN